MSSRRTSSLSSHWAFRIHRCSAVQRPDPAARPCRLRRCFTPAPSSSRLRPHGRAAPSRWCGAPQRHGQAHGHRVPGHAPALARASRVTAAHLQLAPDAWPGPLPHPGAQRRDFLLGPVARAVHPPPAASAKSTDQLGLWEHVARHSLCESGATGSSRSLAPRPHGAPGSQAPAVAQSAFTLCSRRCAVQSLHLGKRRHQLTEASATILRKAAARSLKPPSRLSHAGPVEHALAAVPPAAPSPLDPPNLGTPFPLASLAEKESPGGKDALARRRSEWPRTATAGSPRGERRATTAPRSRPFPASPCHHHGGLRRANATGPAGAGQASRLDRRRALMSPRPRR